MNNNHKLVQVKKGNLNYRHREGTGFSLSEIKETEKSVKEIRELGIRVDIRRKSKHSVNVEFLQSLLQFEKEKKTKKNSKSVKKEKKEKNEKKTGSISETKLRQMYNEETGKEALYRGNITKLFLKWKENKLEELEK
ncbi:MAG: ribosomal protein L13e [Promethearchaeota archaeon]